MLQFGYNKLDFKRQAAIDKTTGDKLYKADSDTGNKTNIYYYKHYYETACYYCIVNAEDANISKLSIDDGYYNQKLLAYYRAIGREKYNLVKASNYINSSGEQRDR